MAKFYGDCCGVCVHYCYEDAIDHFNELKNVPVGKGYIDADIGWCPHVGDSLEKMDAECAQIRFGFKHYYGGPTGALHAYRWSTHTPCSDFKRYEEGAYLEMKEAKT